MQRIQFHVLVPASQMGCTLQLHTFPLACTLEDKIPTSAPFAGTVVNALVVVEEGLATLTTKIVSVNTKVCAR